MEYEKLCELLAQTLDVAETEIRLERSFVADYGADSLVMLQVLMAVEATFGIIIPEEEAFSWETVGDLWEFLHSKKLFGNEE